MSDDVDKQRNTQLAIGLFAAIFLFIAWDLVTDYGEGSGTGHLVVELTVLLLAACGFGLLWHRLRLARSVARSLEVDLVKARKDVLRWRGESQELVEGLGIAIARQFKRWQLSKAEADVGLLLLKGLSHKEIGGIRNTSERTVREQARALYRKSGLSGRSALSAFFLEDLLLPQ